MKQHIVSATVLACMIAIVLFSAGCGSAPSAPKITAIIPEQPEHGGLIQIKGENFQILPQTRKLVLNGTEITNFVSWSDQVVLINVPADLPLTGTLSITVDGQSSNSIPVKLKRPLGHLGSVTPSSGAPGTAVVIAGTWLGETAGKVTFGGKEAKVKSWSDTKIEAVVPGGAAPGPLGVTVDGRELNLLPFDLIVPTLKSITPTIGLAGTPFELSGKGFGTDAQAGKILFGTIDVKPTKWTDTTITGVVPTLPLDKKELPVKVIVNEIATSARMFQLPQFPDVGVIEEAGEVHEWTIISSDASGWPVVMACKGGAPEVIRWDGQVWQVTAIDDASFKSGQFHHMVGFSLDMKLDDKGTTHATGVDFYDGGIFYASCTADGSQKVERVLKSGPRDHFGVSIGLDPSGAPVVASFAESQGLRIFEKSHAGWMPQFVDNRPGEGFDTAAPKFAFDRSGRIHVAYYDPRGTTLMYATREGSAWKTSTIDSGPKVGDGLALALDAGGSPIVAYRDFSGAGALRVARLAGQAWSVKTIDQAPNSARQCAIAVDQKGKVHIVHSTGTTTETQAVERGRMIRKITHAATGLRYVTDAGGTWKAGVLAADTGKEGWRPSLTINKDGRKLLSYYGFTSHKLNFQILE